MDQESDGTFYQPIAFAPKDGSPVHLVFEDSPGVKRVTPATFKFDGRNWRSTATDLVPTAPQTTLIGWRWPEKYGDAL